MQTARQLFIGTRDARCRIARRVGIRGLASRGFTKGVRGGSRKGLDALVRASGPTEVPVECRIRSFSEFEARPLRRTRLGTYKRTYQGTLARLYAVASVVARLRSEPLRPDPNTGQPPHAAARRERSVPSTSRPGFGGCTQARILSACPVGHARSQKQGASGGEGRGTT